MDQNLTPTESLYESNPLVSVIISTHNRAEYLRKAIGSVLSQTFTDFELILCDDASIDETPFVCQEFERQDDRVRVLRHEHNLGMVSNWNSGLYTSRGRYFAKLDDDNLYLPTFLEKTVAALETTPGASFAFSDEWFINADGQRLNQVTESNSKKYGRTNLTAGLHYDTASLAVNQSASINSSVFITHILRSVGGFRDLGGTIADLDVFLNLAHQKHLGAYVPDRLAEYREHSGMGTNDLLINTVKAKNAIAIWMACCFDGEAEQSRRLKLAVAFTSLCRASVLNFQLAEAREAIREASHLAPGHPRIIAIRAFLSLPEWVIHRAMRLRYQRSIELE